MEWDQSEGGARKLAAHRTPFNQRLRLPAHLRERAQSADLHLQQRVLLRLLREGAPEVRLERFALAMPDVAPTLVVAGGVAANRAIGAGLRTVAASAAARLVVPPIPLCTDNGAMVAWAAAERLALGDTDGFDIAAKARWPLDSADMRRGHAA